MTRKATFMNEDQISFFDILDADDKTYEAICVARDPNCEIKFSRQLAHIIIRDSFTVMTAVRSNLQQRLDEIAWVFSDKNQENLCSFTNCCNVTGLDPLVVRGMALRRWKQELESTQKAIDSGHHSAPENLDYFRCQQEGLKYYEIAFRIHLKGIEKYRSELLAQSQKAS